MVIKRSTLEFIIIAIMLGSLMASATYLGPGAGVLMLLLWAIGFFLWLKFRNEQTNANGENSPADSKQSDSDH